MASGTLGNTFQTGYRIQIDWTSTPNENNLTSNIIARFYLITNPSYDIRTSVKKICKITIDGKTESYSVDTNMPAAGTTWKLLATKTQTVTHNKETGKATVNISGSLGIKATLSGRYFDTPSIGNKAFALDNIEVCQFYYAIDGTQRRCKGVYYGIGGSWIKVPVYCGVNNAWKKVSN